MSDLWGRRRTGIHLLFSSSSFIWGYCKSARDKKPSFRTVLTYKLFTTDTVWGMSVFLTVWQYPLSSIWWPLLRQWWDFGFLNCLLLLGQTANVRLKERLYLPFQQNCAFLVWPCSSLKQRLVFPTASGPDTTTLYSVVLAIWEDAHEKLRVGMSPFRSWQTQQC